MSFYNGHVLSQFLCVHSVRSPKENEELIMTVQLVTDNVKLCLQGDMRWHQFKIYQLDICLLTRTTSQQLGSEVKSDG